MDAVARRSQHGSDEALLEEGVENSVPRCEQPVARSIPGGWRHVSPLLVSSELSSSDTRGAMHAR